MKESKQAHTLREKIGELGLKIAGYGEAKSALYLLCDSVDWYQDSPEVMVSAQAMIAQERAVIEAYREVMAGFDALSEPEREAASKLRAHMEFERENITYRFSGEALVEVALLYQDLAKGADYWRDLWEGMWSVPPAVVE